MWYYYKRLSAKCTLLRNPVWLMSCVVRRALGRRATKRHDARQSDTTDDKATRRIVVMSCRFVAMSCRFVAMSCRFVVRRLSTGVEVAFYHRHRDGVFGSVVIHRTSFCKREKNVMFVSFSNAKIT